MLSEWEQIGIVAAAGALAFGLFWLRQTKTKDASSVDVAWSLGIGLAAIFIAVTGEGDPGRRILAGALGGFWGLRLGLHLLVDRVLKSEEEDGRYRKLRREWGESAGWKFFLVYQVQAALVVLLAGPFALASASEGFPAWSDYGAAGLWIVGMAGESIADRQLARFRRDPGNKGRVCRSGLWRYSRHPNYFFEWLLWCAFALLALPHDWGWAAVYAPLLMLALILKVSGVPPTEARAIESRGEEYRRYQRETSVFVPWFPKQAEGAPR